jgi:TPP-dependent 2-oxoacid decarboxylase
MSTEKTANQIDKKTPEYWEEKVPVYIEESLDGASLPVNVSVNGECITVARGVEVMVKRKFAEVINNAKKSERERRAFIKKSSNKKPAEA